MFITPTSNKQLGPVGGIAWRAADPPLLSLKCEKHVFGAEHSICFQVFLGKHKILNIYIFNMLVLLHLNIKKLHLSSSGVN